MSASASGDDEKTPKGITQVEEEKEKKDESAVEYPSNQKRVLIMTSLYLAIFLVTLVRLNGSLG
jgi:hypothetical protein